MNDQEFDDVKKSLDQAIINMVQAYCLNVPDALEVILQITMREVLKTVDCEKEASATFRAMAHEIIDLT